MQSEYITPLSRLTHITFQPHHVQTNLLIVMSSSKDRTLCLPSWQKHPPCFKQSPGRYRATILTAYRGTAIIETSQHQEPCRPISAHVRSKHQFKSAVDFCYLHEGHTVSPFLLFVPWYCSVLVPQYSAPQDELLVQHEACGTRLEAIEKASTSRKPIPLSLSLVTLFVELVTREGVQLLAR